MCKALLFDAFGFLVDDTLRLYIERGKATLCNVDGGCVRVMGMA